MYIILIHLQYLQMYLLFYRNTSMPNGGKTLERTEFFSNLFRPRKHKSIK